MSPAKDFGDHDDQSDKSQDQPAKEDPTMLPEPIEPDHTEPTPDKAIEAPKPADEARIDVETPSVGQLYAMFPDAMPKNTPERRARHLAAVPDVDQTDPQELPAGDIENDLDDPWVAAALRWRAVIAFWWRPAVTGAVVVAITVIAFFAVGAAVGIAWFIYGVGWTGHSVWTTHGRPNLHQLARAKRARW